MKKDGKYRFSLQFAADSDEHIQAGELLEQLGNKKSAVIIAAVNEYIQNHPEIGEKSCKIEVRITSGYDRDKIEEIIKNMLEERLASIQSSGENKNSTIEINTLEDDIAQMLDNIDLFQ